MIDPSNVALNATLKRLNAAVGWRQNVLEIEIAQDEASLVVYLADGQTDGFPVTVDDLIVDSWCERHFGMCRDMPIHLIDTNTLPPGHIGRAYLVRWMLTQQFLRGPFGPHPLISSICVPMDQPEYIVRVVLNHEGMVPSELPNELLGVPVIPNGGSKTRPPESTLSGTFRIHGR